MPLDFVAQNLASALPIHVVPSGGLDGAGLPANALRWARAAGFKAATGELSIYPAEDGGVGGALFGVGKEDGPWAPFAYGFLARSLPDGDWRFAGELRDPFLAALSMRLGAYVFTRYGRKDARTLRVALPQSVDAARLGRVADGVFLARDLINTPANDMGPDALEAAAYALAKRHKARMRVTRGDALLKAKLPMIHAVGRAAEQAPRLVDIQWGPKNAPKVTLVGKGVSFDTGGLDIKPASGMLLMKKDMGGAANVLGLASMIMAAKLNLRLRVLLPIVENAIAGNAFRPGDVLPSRKGLTVEIGNTDAEGRLILADALALADEEEPELLIDMATLTGAARVALGPDLPPFYTDSDTFSDALLQASEQTVDPLWRMPLWRPYDAKLSSKIADLNNVTTDGFAGSVTAALFLRRFVEKAATWAHFDVYGWSPNDRAHGTTGGEAQAIRALEHYLSARYPAA